MEGNATIAALSPQGREALALCGITQDKQLAAIAPQALRRDMEMAAVLFPENPPAIPALAELEALCRRAAAAQGVEEAPIPAATAPQRSAATGRTLRRDIAPARAHRLDEHRRMDDPRGFSHSICCVRPFSAYLGAWATWLLVLCALALLACGVGVALGQEWKPALAIATAATAGVALLYGLFLWRATCSTCRIPLFSFRRYPRHRDAHHFPLLGYTLSTALTVMFRFRFRCPSCSTPQKLGGRRRRKH